MHLRHKMSFKFRKWAYRAIQQKAARMSPDDKVFKFLDALLPSAECVRFVERRLPCVVDIDIGMPSLRVPRLRADGLLPTMIGILVNPLATLNDPSLLSCLYKSLRDDALASDPDAINDLG